MNDQQRFDNMSKTQFLLAWAWMEIKILYYRCKISLKEIFQ